MAVEFDLSKSVDHKIVNEKLEYHLPQSSSNWLKNIWLDNMFLEEDIYAFAYR